MFPKKMRLTQKVVCRASRDSAAATARGAGHTTLVERARARTGASYAFCFLNAGFAEHSKAGLISGFVVALEANR